MFFKAGRKGGLFVAPGRLDRIGAHEINKIVRPVNKSLQPVLIVILALIKNKKYKFNSKLKMQEIIIQFVYMNRNMEIACSLQIPGRQVIIFLCKY